MFQKTFNGGIHPDYHKALTAEKPIEKAILPKQVVILLQQHSGAVYEPIVKVGDYVKVGQKIGDSSQFVSAPIHSSVSGNVTKIEPHLCFTGAKVPSITIESDGQFQIHENIKPYPDDLSAAEILNAIKESGIVGMGGAAFPTHIKLSPPKEAKVDILLINGAECEPYLTCDHRIMLEEPALIAYGIELVKKVLSVTDAYIVIEENKKDAIELLKQKVLNAKIIEVETKYPQGGEKQLIKAATGREVPSGGLPYQAGVVVINVGTCAQIARSLKTGMPVVERVVTVSGKYLKTPKNLLAKVGTLFRELIEQCGGVSQGQIKKVLCGGPMMGIATPSMDVPIVKGTSGILVLTEKEIDSGAPVSCIRCARCVDVCPMSLLPNLIADYAEKGRFDDAEKLGAMDCIECGACAYVCGSKRNLVELIKKAKAAIARKRLALQRKNARAVKQ